VFRRSWNTDVGWERPVVWLTDTDGVAMAYPTHIAAALSGASLRQLQYWRESDLLVPELGKSGGRVLYSFSDVVALRTFVFLREEASLQLVRKAVGSLRDLGNLDHLATYKLRTVGDRIVLVEPSGRVLDLTGTPGQYRIEAVMGDVLRPFTNMQGATVVDLRNPRRHLVVDPETQGGYPVIAGTRLQFDLIASLVHDGVPPGEVKNFYPSVSAAAARDAADFARLVERFREGGMPSAA
jgi:uncharacterized protein (DUF433 family)/DNA-binding transcriptional MerR regulator